MTCPVCNHESEGRLCRECGDLLRPWPAAPGPSTPMQPLRAALALRLASLIARLPDDGLPVLARPIPRVVAE